MVKFYFKPRKKRAPPVKAKRFMFAKKKRSFAFITVCTVLIFAIVLTVGEIKIRPIIKSVGATALKNELTILYNQAVNDTVIDEQSVYSDFVTVNYNDNAEISAIESNTVYINAFKAKLSENIANTIAENRNFDVNIALGTVLDGTFLDDYGLELRIDSDTYGYAVTDIYSTFESVGINQTLHKIYVEIEMSATAYIGDYKVHETVEGKVPVAETVIVGNVPEYYTERR